MSPNGRCSALMRAAAVSWMAVLTCGPGLAFEAKLSAPGAPKALGQRLSEASAVIAAQSRGRQSVQEIVAASLSDYKTLVQILYDAGYFSPVVHIRLDGAEAAYIKPLHLPARIGHADVTVTIGRPFRFGRANMAPLAPGTDLPEGFASGRPANTAVLQEAGLAGLRGWRDAGHPKARIGPQHIVAHHDTGQLDADIEVLPGPRLRFGKMYLHGQTAVRPGSIHRIAGFPTGEVYHPDKIQTVGTRLRRTGTFSSVVIREREAPNADGTLDYDATVQDMPPRRLTLGGSVSSSAGLDLSLAWLHRNLFGGGERLQTQARIRNIGGAEAVDGVVSVRLERPDRLGPDDSLFYLAETERRNRTNYDELRGLLGIGVRRNFANNLHGEASLGLAYSKADDAYGNNRPFRYVDLPVRLEWDKRDSKVSATRGVYLSASATPYAGLGGTSSGAQVKADGRGYWSPGVSNRIVFAGRIQIGSVVGSPQSDTAPNFLFYSGGAGTVRGHPYESLGTSVGTATAGGRSFLGLSAELRGRVTDTISLVGFYDYGAVDSGSFVNSLSARHAGAGVGLRYDLGGFGPIRVDFAWPVTGTTGEGMQFYIGIGQAF